MGIFRARNNENYNGSEPLKDCREQFAWLVAKGSMSNAEAYRTARPEKKYTTQSYQTYAYLTLKEFDVSNRVDFLRKEMLKQNYYDARMAMNDLEEARAMAKKKNDCKTLVEIVKTKISLLPEEVKEEAVKPFILDINLKERE